MKFTNLNVSFSCWPKKKKQKKVFYRFSHLSKNNNNFHGAQSVLQTFDLHFRMRNVSCLLYKVLKESKKKTTIKTE